MQRNCLFIWKLNGIPVRNERMDGRPHKSRRRDAEAVDHINYMEGVSGATNQMEAVCTCECYP